MTISHSHSPFYYYRKALQTSIDAGLITKLMTYPFSYNHLIKTSKLNYGQSRLVCMRKIVKEFGVTQLWRGNFVELVRYVPEVTFSYSTKEYFRVLFNEDINDQIFTIDNVFINFTSAFLGGGIAQLIVHPLYSIDLNKVAERKAKTKNKFPLHRGLFVTIPSTLVYRGVSFGLFDTLKPIYAKKNVNLDNFLCDILLGYLVCSCSMRISYPFDEVRSTLLMSSAEKISFKIYSEEIKKKFKIEHFKNPQTFRNPYVGAILFGVLGFSKRLQIKNEEILTPPTKQIAYIY